MAAFIGSFLQIALAIALVQVHTGNGEDLFDVEPIPLAPEAPSLIRSLESFAVRDADTPKPECTTKNGNLPMAKNGLIDTRYRWKNFNVYIDSAYNDDDRTKINNAMWYLSQAVPCISFGIYGKGPKPTSGDFIHIKNLSGCWSQVGKRGGAQDMSLQNPGCMDNGIIMHEMIHALGLDHEHCRADRDDYVTVNRQNIQSGKEHNFDKVGSGSSAFGVPYNIKSIMHYGSDAFSKDGRSPTMTKKNGETFRATLQLQQTDQDKLRKMYNC